MSVRMAPSASSRGKAENPRRLLLWAGIIAPILFATVFMIDGFLKPGYSAYSEAISYLEVGTNGWCLPAARLSTSYPRLEVGETHGVLPLVLACPLSRERLRVVGEQFTPASDQKCIGRC